MLGPILVNVSFITNNSSNKTKSEMVQLETFLVSDAESLLSTIQPWSLGDSSFLGNSGPASGGPALLGGLRSQLVASVGQSCLHRQGLLKAERGLVSPRGGVTMGCKGPG